MLLHIISSYILISFHYICYVFHGSHEGIFYTGTGIMRVAGSPDGTW